MKINPTAALITATLVFSSDWTFGSECELNREIEKRFSVQCNGIEYNISVPEICEDQQCGIILDVHGWTMNARRQNENTGLAEKGLENGYITIQPNAPGGSWSTSHYPHVYDFLLQNISFWNVDREGAYDRFSQGAMMTWHFVCAYPDLIASAAPIGYHAIKSCYEKVRKILGYRFYIIRELAIALLL